MLLEQVAILPNGAQCREFWALEATGADVARNPAAFVGALKALVAQARAAGAEYVILGGAVLAGYVAKLTSDGPFIDPVKAAIARVACTPADLLFVPQPSRASQPACRLCWPALAPERRTAILVSLLRQ